jgi:hypothetical protein
MWTETKTPKVLTDVYQDWFDNGIFKQLEVYDVPWKDYVDGSTLDLDYYGNRSGEKIVSSLIEKLMVDDVLSTERQAKIAQLIWQKYGHSWHRAWEAVMKDYDPLYNYSMRREEIEDKTLKIDNSRDINKTIADTGDITKTNTGTVETNGTDELTHNTSNEYSSDTNNDIFGFNSSSASNADKTSTTQNNSSNATDNSISNSTVTDDRTEVVARNTSTTDVTSDTEDNTHKTDGKLEITQEGNIGVTTSQQMLESELKLRFDWNL